MAGQLMVTVLANEWPVARKPHVCQMCGRQIDPGERYNRQRNIGDDGPYVFKSCAHCDELLKQCPGIMEYADDGYTFDTILDWDAQHDREATWKERWHCRWRRDDGTLYPIPRWEPDLTDPTDVEAWLNED